MTDRGPPCSCTLLTNPIPEKRTRQNDSTRAPWHTTGATRQILGTIQDVLEGPGSHEQTGMYPAWRIIPVSKWLITMVSKSPKWGYSPYKWPNFMACK